MVRRYIERGLEPPSYGPRPPQPKSTDPFLPYLHERLAAYPSLTAVRLWRELRERCYAGIVSFPLLLLQKGLPREPCRA